MDENREMITVPYVVYEGAQTRSERIIKRLIITLVIVTAMLFVSNIIWIYNWTQYDYESGVSEDVILHTDGEGDASYIGEDGDIINGNNYNP